MLIRRIRKSLGRITRKPSIWNGRGDFTSVVWRLISQVQEPLTEFVDARGIGRFMGQTLDYTAGGNCSVNSFTGGVVGPFEHEAQKPRGGQPRDALR
jgi:hypothetical protein